MLTITQELNKYGAGAWLHFILFSAAEEQKVLKSFFDLEVGKYYVLVGHHYPWMGDHLYASQLGTMHGYVKLDRNKPFKVRRISADLKGLLPYGYVTILVNGQERYFQETLSGPGYLYMEVG